MHIFHDIPYMVVLLRRQFLIGIHCTVQLAGIVLSGIGFRIGTRNFGIWDTLPLGNMAFYCTLLSLSFWDTLSWILATTALSLRQDMR